MIATMQWKHKNLKSVRSLISLPLILLIVGCDGDQRKSVVVKDVDGVTFLVDENRRTYGSNELRTVDLIQRFGEFTFKNQCVQLVQGSQVYTPVLENTSIIEAILAARGVNLKQDWEVFGEPMQGRFETTVKQCPPPYFYLTGTARYTQTPPPPPPPSPRPFDPPRR